MTPAVARERKRCARIAAAHEETYRLIAEKSEAAGDDEHKKRCLLRMWVAEEIRKAIENGARR